MEGQFGTCTQHQIPPKQWNEN